MSRITAGARRAAAVFAVAALVLLGTFGVAEADKTPGVDRFGSCLNAQHSGQVLLLIDESGSLTQSDPGDARVTAAKYLVGRLESFTKTTGAKLDIAIAGFADQYRVELGWTPLTADNAGKVTAGVESFAGRKDGKATDYWAALTGANATLAEKRPEGGAQSCQMIAWFTDGKIDFDKSASGDKPYAPGVKPDSDAGIAEMQRAAKDGICRAGGVADQLRSSGVITVAIGLQSETASASDFDTLKAIATGTGCGGITTPVPGDFFPVAKISDLLLAFDRISTPGQPPIEGSAGACVREVCEQGKHRFVLDSSVNSVSVLANAEAPGLVPWLIAPKGQKFELKGANGTGTVGGVTYTYKDEVAATEPAQSTTVSVGLSGANAEGWAGVWAVVFVTADDKKVDTKSNIHLIGDLVPALAQADIKLRAAPDQSLSFVVNRRSGERADVAAAPGQVVLAAELVTASGTTVPIATGLSKDKITAPQKVDLSKLAPGAATLKLSLDVTTASARDANGTSVQGTKLAAQQAEVPVTIAAPVGYPSVPGTVDLGKLTGSGTLTGRLSVSGDGCATVGGVTTLTARPDGLPADVKVTGGEACAGGELTVSLPVAQAVNGTVAGKFTVLLQPKEAGAKAIPMEVKFTGALEKPIDTGTALAALIAALTLGPGIPLLLMYLAKRVATQIPAGRLSATGFPVTIDGTTILRDGAPFAVSARDFVGSVDGTDKRSRSLDLGGGVSLRARTGRSPFGVGFVTAVAPGRAGAAGRRGDGHGPTPEAKLPLAVHNSWFVLIDPAGSPREATVWILLGADATDATRTRIVGEITQVLAQVVGDLRNRARPADAGSTPPNPAQQPPSDDLFGQSAPSANPYGRRGAPSPQGMPGVQGPTSGYGGLPAPPVGRHGSPPAGGNPYGGRGPGAWPGGPPRSPGQAPGPGSGPANPFG